MDSPQSLGDHRRDPKTGVLPHSHPRTALSLNGTTAKTNTTSELNMSQSMSETTAYRRRLPSGTSKTGRRQYHSCDQCRKGKRACDVVLSEEPDSKHQSAAPCSNCAKTRKSCTLDWLNSNQPSMPKGKERRDTTPIQQELIDFTAEWAPLWEDSWTSFDKGIGLDDQNISNNNFELPLSPTTLSVPGMSQQSCSDIGSDNSVPFIDFSLNPAQEIESAVTTVWSPESAFTYPPIPGTDYSLVTGSVPSQSVTTSTNLSASPIHKNITPAARSPKRRRSWRPPPHGLGSECRIGTPAHNVRRNSSYFQLNPRPYSDSPGLNFTSYEHHVALSYNKTLITSGLVRIYHDSLENALSCWLTETTCPYNVTHNTTPIQGGQDLNSGPTKSHGRGWSNRICEQVCHLDKSFSRLRTTPLTASEDKAVDMSLRKAITAFATQWANSSERSSSQYSTESPSAAGSILMSEVELDRSMQESSWHEAKNALQNTAEIESFRVIFAHVIFALTQKPLDAEDKFRELAGRKCSGVTSEAETSYERDRDDCEGNMDQCRGSNTTATSETHVTPESTLLEQVLDLNGPPVSLETALRQIYTLRCRLEAIEARARKKQKQNAPQETPNVRKSTDILSPQDRQTFNFLFWLCVMFDTLSSAITSRPLVVSDEDSDINRNPSETQKRDANVQFAVQYAADSTVQINISQAHPASDRRSTQLWGRFFLEKGPANTIAQKASVLRWPCSYEAAEMALCDAAPIKVLLYRKVTRLQTLLTRHAGSQTFESGISDALAIRDYWNNTYGLFFRDCIVHHESLPPRIQSWYTVLCGHWHLAGLLLADLIEDIDDQEMTVEQERLKRKTTCLVENIRREDAYAASDLGRASCPRTSESFPQAKEFHTAVNKGALLTEPWTDVLVRSFSKAGSLLINMLPESVTTGSFDEVKARCEVCVEALWHLGKKSDIALLASQVLRDEMNEKITGMEAVFTGDNLDTSSRDNWLDTCPDPWDINPLGVFDDRIDTSLFFLENSVTAW